MTFNGVMAVILRYLGEIGTFGGPVTSQWYKLDLLCLRQKGSQENLYSLAIS